MDINNVKWKRKDRREIRKILHPHYPHVFLFRHQTSNVKFQICKKKKTCHYICGVISIHKTESCVAQRGVHISQSPPSISPWRSNPGYDLVSPASQTQTASS